MNSSGDDQAGARPSRASQTSPWLQHQSIAPGNMEYVWGPYLPQFQSMASERTPVQLGDLMNNIIQTLIHTHDGTVKRRQEGDGMQ